jgi:CRP-like cAMP-binding protein
MHKQIAEPPDVDQDPPSGYRPETLPEQLRGSRLFAAMPEGEVLQVVRSFDEQHFNAGHAITLRGLRGTDFFLIVDGDARVSVDGWTVGRLGAGDFFGELGVLGDGLRFATVTAETPMRCLVLPHGRLKALLVDHPQMGVNMLGEVVNRFHDLAEPSRPHRETMAAG